jgi:transcriptional regulator with GAF, ATPase, and Fis domain
MNMHSACKETPESSDAMMGGIGSPSFEEVTAAVGFAARTDVPVMITGDSAAEHHRLARLIHVASVRGSRRFAAVRCGGVHDTLLESKLFGHVRGSFAGAISDQRGILEATAGGTVFLDDVGDATPRIQARLFEFLQDGKVSRLGDDGPMARVDVRIVTGTTRDLQYAIATGSFRADLFYRLNVLHFVLPPRVR